MTCTSQVDIKTVQALVTALQNDDQEEAEALLDDLTQLRESELYQRLNGLTNCLHGTLDELIDNELLLQTKHDIPDMTERLEYVLASTAEACDKTLASTEKAMDASESIHVFIQNNLTDEQQAQIENRLSELNTELTNILLTQSFQDLTGQVLDRVMLMLSSLEQSLIQLISKSRHDYDAIPDREEADRHAEKAVEMKGVGPNVTQKLKQDAFDTQEDVDDLLGELGI